MIKKKLFKDETEKSQKFSFQPFSQFLKIIAFFYLSDLVVIFTEFIYNFLAKITIVKVIFFLSTFGDCLIFCF